MKKIIAFMLAAAMLLSMTACGKEAAEADPGAETPAAAPTEPVKAEKEEKEEKKPEQQAKEPEKQPEAEPVPEAPEPAEEEEIVDEAWDELESLGNIETENGVLLVSITMPADLVGEITQEELDAEAGEEFVSAKLNDDGSVTYKLTKKQHKAMLDEFSAGLDEALQEMVDDEEYAYTEIRHNADFTEFDVTLSTDEVGLMESIMSLAFYMYAGFYGIFSGQEPENVAINYYNPGGELIETANSADMA